MREYKGALHYEPHHQPALKGVAPGKRWLAFLQNHRGVIVAFDFFTVPTVTFKLKAYARPQGHWVAYFIAAVLVHEAVHARGDGRESPALLEELLLDRCFKRIGKLPAAVDTAKLAEYYLKAVEDERRQTSGLSEPERRAKR